MLPTTIWEENEQKVNGLRINRLLANNWEFSPAESLEVLNIAAQCPRTNGLVSIELPITDKKYTLCVFDVLGNLMLNQAVTNGVSVDLSTFVSGMYIFRIAEEEKIIKSEKIIKLD